MSRPRPAFLDELGVIHAELIQRTPEEPAYWLQLPDSDPPPHGQGDHFTTLLIRHARPASSDGPASTNPGRGLIVLSTGETLYTFNLPRDPLPPTGYIDAFQVTVARTRQPAQYIPEPPRAQPVRVNLRSRQQPQPQPQQPQQSQQTQQSHPGHEASLDEYRLWARAQLGLDTNPSLPTPADEDEGEAMVMSPPPTAPSPPRDPMAVDNGAERGAVQAGEREPEHAGAGEAVEMGAGMDEAAWQGPFDNTGYDEPYAQPSSSAAVSEEQPSRSREPTPADETPAFDFVSQPRLIDDALLEDWRDDMVRMRTEQAIRAAKREALCDIFKSADYATHGQSSLAAMEARAASREGVMTLAELRAHIHLVKLLVVPAAQSNKLSRVDLEAYLRQIDCGRHGRWFMDRIMSLAPLWLTTSAEFAALLDEHPELDARRCNSAGTYLIITVYKQGKGPERMTWYVGEATDQTVADRQTQHDANFEGVRDARTRDDLLAQMTQGQRALYRPDWVRRYHIVLTSNPAGSDLQAQADWLTQRFFALFGVDILAGDFLAGDEVSARLLVKMITSVDELIASAILDTVWNRFPGIHSLDLHRYDRRQDFLGVNGQVPFMAFRDILGSKAARVAQGEGRPVPGSREELRAQNERTARRLDILSSPIASGSGTRAPAPPTSSAAPTAPHPSAAAPSAAEAPAGAPYAPLVPLPTPAPDTTIRPPPSRSNTPSTSSEFGGDSAQAGRGIGKRRMYSGELPSRTPSPSNVRDSVAPSRRSTSPSRHRSGAASPSSQLGLAPVATRGRGRSTSRSRSATPTPAAQRSTTPTPMSQQLLMRARLAAAAGFSQDAQRITTPDFAGEGSQPQRSTTPFSSGSQPRGPSARLGLAPVASRGRGRTQSPASLVSGPASWREPSVTSSQRSFGSAILHSPRESQRDGMNTQNTSIELNPILGEAVGNEVAQQLLQGYPCEVTETTRRRHTTRRLRIDLGDEQPLNLALPGDLPAGPARLVLERLDEQNPTFACQPRSCSIETSYILRHFRLRLQSLAAGASMIWAPFGEDVDWEWDRACRRLAEAMMTRYPSDHFAEHTERLADTELLDGIAIRLRDGGARFRLRWHPERRTWFFDIPGNRMNYRAFGTATDVPNSQLEFQGLDRNVLYDVILRVVRVGGSYRRLEFALRTRDDATPISDSEWKAFDAPHSHWQLRYFINLVRGSFTGSAQGERDLMRANGG